MSIIDVVKLDFQPGELVKKFTADRLDYTELSTWTQLIVNESQEAVLFRQGALDGPFPPGRHVLKTENIPVIGKVLNLPFGRSPFTAEVWFINRTVSLDIKWGTPNPIRITDPYYQIIVPITARGQFGIQVSDSKKFLVKIVGTFKKFDSADFKKYFQGVVLATSQSVLSKEIIDKKISVLDIPSKFLDISKKIEETLTNELEKFGLSLVNFYIDNLELKDDSEKDENGKFIYKSAIRTLEEATATRARLGIVGVNYQQDRSLEILQDAARNEGTSGSIMGAGIGVGLGAGIGVPIGSAMGNISNNLNSQSEKNMSDKLSLLNQLNELKKSGALTDEEFEQQKKIILQG
jgi:membrane protease subunit (stomatin/prohibitin family)